MLKLKKRSLLILLACGLINFSMGSLYAWSVFLEPLQTILNVSRSEVSVVFSFITICTTLTMLFGSKVYRYVHAVAIATGLLLLGACGIAIAARATSLPLVILGYGVIFGIANGFGYNFSLLLINNEFTENAGFATGLVLSCYAVSPVLFAPVFIMAIQQEGVQVTLLGLSLFLALAAVISGSLLALAGVTRVTKQSPEKKQGSTIQPRVFLLLWLGFACGALAGLMVISHAAGIVATYGGTPAQIALGTMLVSIGNVAGRLSAGWLSEHWPVRRILTAVTSTATIALFILVLLPSVWVAIVVLMLIGVAYGAYATAYPISVTAYYGAARLAKVFGMLMTAWALAGLSAPYIAGIVFDSTGQYKNALILATLASVTGTMVSILLPQQQQQIIMDKTPDPDVHANL